MSQATVTLLSLGTCPRGGHDPPATFPCQLVFKIYKHSHQYLSPYYVPGTVANMFDAWPHLLLTVAWGPIIPTLSLVPVPSPSQAQGVEVCSLC